MMFSLMGLLIITATLAGYFYPSLARVEDELPDALLTPESRIVERERAEEFFTN